MNIEQNFELIGKEFVKHFYTRFDTDRSSLQSFYVSIQICFFTFIAVSDICLRDGFVVLVLRTPFSVSVEVLLKRRIFKSYNKQLCGRTAYIDRTAHIDLLAQLNY